MGLVDEHGCRKIRADRYFLVIFGLCTIWGLICKSVLFDRMSYTSDLLRFTQASRTWLEGLPLFFEFNRGADSYLHNNFIILAFAPFTFLFGSRGIFFAAAALQLGAAVLCFKRLSLLPWPSRISGLLLLTAFLFGPTAFWLWDNPIYGWHPETLYPSLSLFLLLSLESRSKRFWAAAVLIVLVRQDGAVMGWSVHSLFILLQHGERKAKARRLAAATFYWLLVFAAGMAVLRIFAAAGAARVGSALMEAAAVAHDPAHLLLTLRMLAKWAIMLSPFCIVLLLQQGRCILLAAAVCIVPLLAVNLVAAFAYYSMTPDVVQAHGLTWQPRMALPWALGLCALVLGIITDRRGLNGICGVLALVFAVSSQWVSLAAMRHYPLAARLTVPFHSNYPQPELAPQEKQLVACIGRTVPKGAVVSGFGGSEVLFPQTRFIWPENLEGQHQKPDLLICDAFRRFDFEYGCGEYLSRIDRSEYQVAAAGGLRIAFNSRIAAGNCLGNGGDPRL